MTESCAKNVLPCTLPRAYVLLTLLLIVAMGMFFKMARTGSGSVIKLEIRQSNKSPRTTEDIGALPVVDTMVLDTISFPESNDLVHRSGRRFGLSKDFALTFSGKIENQTDLVFTALIASDDGFRFELDGVKICEFSSNRGFETTECQVALSSGSHKWKIDYFQAGGPLGVVAEYSIADNLGKDGPRKLFGVSGAELKFVGME